PVTTLASGELERILGVRRLQHSAERECHQRGRKKHEPAHRFLHAMLSRDRCEFIRTRRNFVGANLFARGGIFVGANSFARGATSKRRWPNKFGPTKSTGPTKIPVPARRSVARGPRMRQAPACRCCMRHVWADTGPS